MARCTGSPEQLERQRRLAVQRVNEGWRRAEVAEFLGVHRYTVNRWMRMFFSGGTRALAAKPAPARQSKLTADQQDQVLQWLTRRPTDFGFSSELWTAPRVAQLIQQHFGVKYHNRYINAWLTERGIRPQKPQRQPREKDPVKIQRWRDEDWSRIKKKPKTSRPILL